MCVCRLWTDCSVRPTVDPYHSSIFQPFIFLANFVLTSPTAKDTFLNMCGWFKVRISLIYIKANLSVSDFSLFLVDGWQQFSADLDSYVAFLYPPDDQDGVFVESLHDATSHGGKRQSSKHQHFNPFIMKSTPFKKMVISDSHYVIGCQVPNCLRR